MGEPRRCILQARPTLPCKLYQYLDEEAIHRITTILLAKGGSSLHVKPTGTGRAAAGPASS